MKNWIVIIILMWCASNTPVFAKEWNADKVSSDMTGTLFRQALTTPNAESFCFMTDTEGKLYGTWVFGDWIGFVNTANDIVYYKFNGSINMSTVYASPYPECYISKDIYGEDRTLSITLWSEKYPEPIDLYLMSYIDYVKIVTPKYGKPYVVYSMQFCERCGYLDWHNQYLYCNGILSGFSILKETSMSVPEPNSDRLVIFLLFLVLLWVASTRNST